MVDSARFGVVRLAVLPLVALLISAAISPVTTRAATTHPDVLPPDSPHYGRSYAEWAAEWWPWAAAQTKGNEIVCGPSGAGSVWFLRGGGGGPPVTKACALPANTPILVPIMAADCSTASYPLRTEAQLRACAAELADTTLTVEATIDGVAVTDLRNYRVASPLITVTDPPADNIFGLPPGTTTAVSDGYWLLLAPLAPGQHTITVHGKASELTGYYTTVTYLLTVEAPGGGTLPNLPNTGAGGANNPSSTPLSTLGLLLALGVAFLVQRRYTVIHR